MLSELWDWRVSCVLLGPCAPGSLGTGLREVTCELIRALWGACQGTEGLQVNPCLQAGVPSTGSFIKHLEFCRQYCISFIYSKPSSPPKVWDVIYFSVSNP